MQWFAQSFTLELLSSLVGRLDGRVAAVTGGGRGIGRAVAFRLAADGAAVLVTDADLEVARECAEEITGRGGRAAALRVDVTELSEVQTIPAACERELGGPVDVMVNNAGIQKLQEAFDITAKAWDRMLAVNARGVLFGMQVAGAVMRERGRGSIVNMASMAGRRGHLLYASYAASKAAVISLTKSFALTLAPHGVRVNSVGPGIIDTELWAGMDAEWAELRGMRPGEPKALRIKEVPLGRAGTADEVASAVAFLASDDAAYITGECVHVTGGSLMI
jgi:NAD(P)-dependent dehydrogenase (short-subunit alcohol dehydrogenase family)